MLKNILSAHCGKCFFQDLLIRSIDFYKANEIEAPVLFGETKLLFQFFPFPVFLCHLWSRERASSFVFVDIFYSSFVFVDQNVNGLVIWIDTRPSHILPYFDFFYSKKLWNYCLLLFSDVVTAVVVVVVCLSLSCH